MGKLNMKEWISQTIQRKETIAIPIMTHPGIEFIGKTVHDAVTNGQVHYEAIQALPKFPKNPATIAYFPYFRHFSEVSGWSDSGLL